MNVQVYVKVSIGAPVKNRTGLSKQEASDVVKLFFDSLTETMIKGERIEIRGFCSFFMKEYAGYTGRNFKTGKKVQVTAPRPSSNRVKNCGRGLITSPVKM